jgi:hypothetical protein
MAFGDNAIQARSTGTFNSAFGSSSIYSLTSGSHNSGFGFSALSSITTGQGNVGVGDTAGAYANHTNCTAIGYNSLQSSTARSNISALGANAGVSGDNQVQLGDSYTTTYAYGAVQNRSDLRDKTDIRDTTLGLDFVNQLRPVDFRWDYREDYRTSPDQTLGEITHDGTHKRTRYHHGLIAQEVPSEFGGLQDHSIKGGEDVLSLGYEELIAPLIKAVQELTAKNSALEARLKALEG